MYNIIFTSRALKSMDDVRGYISQDNPDMAMKVINTIISFSSYLSLFPNLWIEVKKYREIVEPIFRYKIRYSTEGENIYIMVIYKYKNEI